MPRYENLNRADLVRLLDEAEALLGSAEKDSGLQVLHELRQHQIELEIQNRELRESQQALEDARDHYAELYDFAPVGYLSLDRNGIIRNLNLTAAALLGRERSHLVGRPLATILSPGASRPLFDHLRRVYACGEKTVSDLQSQIGKDGAVREFTLESTTRTDPQGQRNCFTLLIDNTRSRQAERERERLQRELAQARKLEALGQLTGGIAHDFNNILSIILGASYVARQLPTQESSDKLKQYMETIDQAGLRAKDLVAQLLTFTRKSPLEAARLSLQPVLKEFLKLSSSTLPSSLELTQDLDPVPEILLSPVAAQQILMNLMINARDAMQGKGLIHISLHVRTLPGAECSSCHRHFSGEWVQLSILDTGPGIPRRLREKVFEPFFTTKPVGRGTGMGLAVVSGIMEQAGGHVSLESSSGGGASFSLFFPLAAESTADSSDAAEDRRNFENPTLRGRALVVDDEPLVAELVEEILHSTGLEVSTFTDSALALRALEQNPRAFDLIVTDQTMPRITGVELVRSIRGFNKDVPVILMTGYSADIDQDNSAALGVSHFIGKPIDVNRFLGIIERVMPKRAS